MNLPECMQPGWDAERPGREYVERILASWEQEGYIPTAEELAELAE